VRHLARELRVRVPAVLVDTIANCTGASPVTPRKSDGPEPARRAQAEPFRARS